MTRAVRRCAGCARAWWAADGPCPACGAGLAVDAGAQAPGVIRAAPRAVDPATAARRLAERVDEAPVPLGAARRASAAPVAVWLPVWTVELRAVAGWSAEIGFEERGRASAAELGARWEPRAGTLERWEEGLEVDALDDPGPFAAALAAGPEGRVPAGLPRGLEGEEPVLLPSRTPERAWPSVLAALRARVAGEVARASGGQRTRALALDLVAEEVRWTCLLLPAYVARYVDRRGRAHLLVVDGRTGAVSGPVLTSAGRARFRAGLWAATGLGSLLVSVIFAVPGILIWPLLVVTVGAGLLGFALCAFAVVPIWRARAHDAAALAGRAP